MKKPLLPFTSAGLAALALGLVLLGGCKPQPATPDAKAGAPSDKPPVIGVTLLNLSAEFVSALDRTMKAEARKLGAELVVNDAQLSADRQIQQVESFVAQKLDAVILNPCQVDGSSPAVDAALRAGIPIVNVNSETRSAPTAFIGSRDEDAGRMAMEFVAQRLNGRGNVVIIEGAMGQAAQIKRYHGAQEVLARHPGLKVVASQTADWDRAKAISLMENWLESRRGGIDAVFAENDEMAMGALLALEQAGVKSKVVVIGVDGIPDALAAVKAGRLDATIFQDAQGQGSAAVAVALQIIRKQPYAKETLIPFRLVTRENVTEFMK
jgi:inositol transport system substrate-binding protein